MKRLGAVFQKTVILIIGECEILLNNVYGEVALHCFRNTHRPDDGASKHRNVSQLLGDCTALYPRKLSPSLTQLHLVYFP
jgi:hypothetical protein